jgi:hypothetical protein
MVQSAVGDIDAQNKHSNSHNALIPVKEAGNKSKNIYIYATNTLDWGRFWLTGREIHQDHRYFSVSSITQHWRLGGGCGA